MQEDRYKLDKERAFGPSNIPSPGFMKGKKEAIQMASALISLKQHYGWKLVEDYLKERISITRFANTPPDQLADFHSRVQEIQALFDWIRGKIKDGGIAEDVLNRIEEEK